MQSKTIHAHALELAKEISNRNIFDIQEIATLIVVHYNNAIPDLLKEHCNKAEEKYNKLVEKYQKQKQGSNEHLMLGYEIGRAKRELKLYNRLSNETRKESLLTLLKIFITEKYGEAVIEEFNEKCKKEIEDIYKRDEDINKKLIFKNAY